MTHHIGGSVEHYVDARVWAAYRRTMRNNRSKWKDDSGAGSVTLSELHDCQNCEVSR